MMTYWTDPDEANADPLELGFLQRHRTALVASFEAGLVLLCFGFAWLVRFEFTVPDPWLLLATAPLLIVVRLICNAHFDLLHGWWRYSGINDALDIVRAVACGSLVFILVIRFLLGISSFPISILVLEPLITMAAMAGTRLLSRAVAESAHYEGKNAKRVVLIGAGFGAQMLLREIRRPRSGYAVVGCLDDNPSKRGIRFHGVSVVGSVSMLPEVTAKYDVEEVLIAVPSATNQQMRRFVAACEQANVRFRTLPSMRDLLTGEATLKQIRDVNLEDLLGRLPIALEMDDVKAQLEDKVVMVTGAAGSIGSELCRQVLACSPKLLLCVDQAENPMFYLHSELSRHPLAGRVRYCVHDVADEQSMSKLFSEHRITAVFHAAAYKHVPIMEQNPHEAIRNNVFALVSLLDIADDFGVKAFVLISSDKAVNPSSVMGATKRIGELILAARPSRSMRCVSVRFGNVIGSNGSVVPILQQQLLNRQPLTVTHPEMTRFFMTIREAVALVLQAYAIGEHRDLLVLDMGEPMRIVDLARTLIGLVGKTPEEVPIVFTGIREGEKLHEELFYPTEQVFATSRAKIKRTRSRLMEWHALDRHLQELRDCLLQDDAALRRKICEIVPECTRAASLPRPVATAGGSGLGAVVSKD